MKKILLSLLIYFMCIGFAYAQMFDGVAITVEEEDGDPSVQGVVTIKVSNDGLTDNTGGSVSIDTAAGSGGGSGGSSAWDDITDPDADSIINFGGYEQRFTSTIDESGGILFSIEHSASSTLTNQTYLMSLQYSGSGANKDFIKLSQNDNDVVFEIVNDGSVTTDGDISAVDISITGDLSIADNKNIYMGTDNDYLMQYDDTASVPAVLAFKTAGDGSGNIDYGMFSFIADTDNTAAEANQEILEIGKGAGDASGGNYVELFTVDEDGDVEVVGDLKVTGDDLFMGTNTDTYLLIADGTNYNPVAMSGDATIDNTGAISIASGVITNIELSPSTISSLTNVTSADADFIMLFDDTDKALKKCDMAEVRGTGSGGGGIWLLPESSVLDDNSPPGITIIESTGTGTPRRRVADFDPDTDEILYWSFTWQDYTTATVFWYANDTGANEDAIWACQISATTEADADSMAEDAADTYNSESEDVDTNEANRLIVTSITLSNTDSASTDDFVTFRFWRDADDSSGDPDADALTSDARLLGVYLE